MIKKPNIKVPAGHELIYNEWGKKWVMRPIKGYSEKYLRPVNRFIPPKNVKETTDEVVEGISTKNNTALNNAKSNKNDEFYTLLSVIEEEVSSYKEYFKGKIVYCPCDKVYNDYRSNFAEYFIRNFHTLGLKKLICTQFNPTGKGTLTEYDFDTCGVGWEYDGHINPCDSFDESDINTYFLKGNGSFDSDECKAIMQKCDVIVTNPPFSLFKEFVNHFIGLGNVVFDASSLSASYEFRVSTSQVKCSFENINLVNSKKSVFYSTSSGVKLSLINCTVKDNALTTGYLMRASSFLIEKLSINYKHMIFE